MRIVFLCSSLEPGRDGVGDYVRTLAAGLERMGHACQLLALHDRWLAQREQRKGRTLPADADGDSLASLRLPARMPWPERVRRAGDWIERFEPDWVSLHFVPYGFHDKGLVFGLGRWLQALTAGHPLHIMFHELWIGDAPGTPWKQRLVGRLQRSLIGRMLRQTGPACVTTSNAVYGGMLEKLGYEAPLLPICGNVPIVQDPEHDWIDEACRRAGLAQVPTARESCWVFVFFGLLHPEWEPEPLFSRVRRAAARAGKTVVMLALGRLGSGEALWTQLARAYGNDFHFLTLGEQSARRVSEVLHSSDIGIAASPWELMGKSGSAACMFDHGLPIIVTRQAGSVPPDEEQAARYFFCDESLEEKLVRGLPRFESASRLPKIAAQLVRLLGEGGAVVSPAAGAPAPSPSYS